MMNAVQDQVWTFRVECFDDTGNLGERVPVEMHLVSMTGTLRDGDIVEIDGAVAVCDLLGPRTIRNVTARSVVGEPIAVANIPGRPF